MIQLTDGVCPNLVCPNLVCTNQNYMYAHDRLYMRTSSYMG